MGVVKSVTNPTAPCARTDDGPRADAGARADVGTREQLARLIGQEGPITVADLAERLHVTATAIRRHLDNMLAEGLVEARELTGPTRRGRGRPAKAFVLTSTGHVAMPTGYDTLAAQALDFLAENFGHQAVTAFAERRNDELAARLAPTVNAAGDDPALRATALADALCVEGFAASARPMAQGTMAEAVQLCQGHCPVQHVAAAYPELCEAETAMFAKLVGVDVRRLATLAGGDHVCTTHIPVGPPEQRRRPVSSPIHATTSTPGPESSGHAPVPTTTAPTAERQS